MDDLYRDLAPIPANVWELLEDAARDVLATRLTGRKLIEVADPQGWETSALRTGETQPLARPLTAGVEARTRVVRPFVELRAEFEISRAAIESVARGAPDLACDDLERGARELALAEDGLIFNGCPEAGWPGLLGEPADALLVVGEEPAFPSLVAAATGRLEERGVAGPYALALGPAPHRQLAQAPMTPGGYPVLPHVKQLLGGPVLRAPALESGGLVISLRGGDFELVLGRDVSLGYVSHDGSAVRLCLLESLALRHADPNAIVPLRSAPSTTSR